MARDHYHIFGLGLNDDDLRWIGWTQRSLAQEQAQIFSDLLRHGDRDSANWVADAIKCRTISIFEIASASSIEEARDQSISLSRYFKSLGLDVATITAEPSAVHIAPCDRSRSQVVPA